jgi:hypothetical protein
VNGMGLAEDGSQAEVADLDLALVAVHEDVVTLEVPVDDGRIVAVQVQQAAEDLPAPMLHRPYVHPSVPLPVPNHHQTRNHNQIQSKNQSSTLKKEETFATVQEKKGDSLLPDMKRQQL